MGEEQTQQEEKIQARAKFNMAVSTLQKLQKILVLITEASICHSQHAKHRLTLQFHIQAVPLITKQQGKTKMNELKEKLRKIKPSVTKIHRYGQVHREEPNFSLKIDYSLDDISEEIQLLLQGEGYFMPPSEEEEIY